MELRHLAALMAVDEARSFRGAAEQLGYVQSAVSQQIAQLEKMVGTRLVERNRGHSPPVRLTDSGRLLCDHASRILAQLQAAQADLRTLDGEPGDTLRVGVIQSIATTLLPAALVDLRDADAHLRVEVTEAPSDRELFALVEAGELDAAFGELPLEPGPFVGTEVVVDPCVLLVPAGSERALAGPPATLAELVELPLVRLRGWPMLDLIEQHLRTSGVDPRFALRADANATAQALVAAGCGAAIMPRLAVTPLDPRVVALDTGDLLPPRQVALYWHADRRRREAVDAFCAAIRRAGERAARERGGPVAALHAS